ncbi:sugar phosphate isomerase/epimerase [Mesorhizobium sp. LHD-90]|uniref:sugar phosphate isomerase/epimerase family protein n=1 Tax=Mesorhizobium sp. LHD-90 TaxID=3071414 RepID=UPI0027E14178|nr:sugar phosphate isomerase/epimerase [Mesorhizobium sp. LHD-90]MDQ6436544.1 sugar phosphate isomerase/epimerase [Mesorhizobium sp. LHD-90]
MTWSFQLYSARNFQPWPDVLKTLSELGYKNVEGFGGLYENSLGLRGELDKVGLAMPSGHFSLDQIEDFGFSSQVARNLDMQLVACPHIAADRRPNDAAGWRAFGERLAKAGKPFQDSGIAFAWHNHDFEFQPLADGSLPMTHILEAAPAIGWEIDVAWVIRGGADPLKWIGDHGDRIVAVHVKDIAPAGQNANEDGWADVGHGSVDWKDLVSTLKAKTQAKFYVMEHDNPSDFRRFASRSIAAAKTY